MKPPILLRTDPPQGTFGARLSLALLDNEFTQTRFATLIGKDPAEICRYCADKIMPNFRTLALIVAYLPGVDARWLLTGKVSKTTRDLYLLAHPRFLETPSDDATAQGC